ncbi:hypothetical protein DEJ50_31045 [Streptomyces venezuelae]|uniref:Uncharacterized protein n=1 Tax=Streptomyces venezuelae TaxID=54571 RepID=A0A5P2DF58_STRVZ|nr:hypothetical protein [Streptomyces venezuelae]QES51629.1 hypothetical protein DEJ50_31045 [Streptomyces venezuelae]
MTSSDANSAAPHPLKTLAGIAAFVLVVGGAFGLLHEWLGWIRFFGFVRFLVPAGHEVLGHTLLIVLGLALGAAGDLFDRGARRGKRGGRG